MAVNVIFELVNLLEFASFSSQLSLHDLNFISAGIRFKVGRVNLSSIDCQTFRIVGSGEGGHVVRHGGFVEVVLVHNELSVLGPALSVTAHPPYRVH